MNTVNLYRYIKSITDQMPLVHSYSNKSVYDYWNTEEVKYGSVVFSVKSVSAREDTTSYNGILYFGDRLLEDRSNVEDIYADATTTLQTILNTLAESDVVEVSYPVSITYFEQKFADQLAGAYADVNLIVRGDVGCDSLIPTLIYPDDNFDPENYYTKSQVDSILARYDSILDDKIVDFVKETDLAEYVSKTELESHHFLTGIPAEYVTDAKLSDVLKEKAYLTKIPEGYITENVLDEKLQKDGYLREIPNYYITEEELESKHFLTEIPPQYITSQELESRKYLTEIPGKYITGEELEREGFLKEIPNYYITEEELESRKYLTEIPGYYITSQELAEQNFATKDYVIRSISGGQDIFENYYTKEETDSRFATPDEVKDIIQQAADLEKYYTKEEVDAKIENVEVDLTGYATEAYVNNLVGKINEVLDSVLNDVDTESLESSLNSILNEI